MQESVCLFSEIITSGHLSLREKIISTTKTQKKLAASNRIFFAKIHLYDKNKFFPCEAKLLGV
jgi:hypothetical protein